MASLLHFVGFRDDRYWNAVKIWGEPDMVHEVWDRYADDDTAPGDIVILAKDAWDAKPRSFTVETARSKSGKSSA